MGKIKLGVEARDKVTGFTGIVIAKSKWLTGCNQYVLKPKVGEDGKMVDAHWFDEGAIEVVGKGIIEEEVQGKKKGGPRNVPKHNKV